VTGSASPLKARQGTARRRNSGSIAEVDRSEARP
jgi:hypothetical protein